MLVYSNQDNNATSFKTGRYYLPKGIIKNYNDIIKRQNFFDHFTNSDIKWYEEIKKLTTGQG